MFYLLASPPLLLLAWVSQRFPKAGVLVMILIVVAVESSAGLIVYGELERTGPVHAIVGHVPENLGVFAGTLAVLLFSFFLTGFLLLAPIVAWTSGRRRIRRHPTAQAVNTLFRCIELAQDRKGFLQPDTRHQLVTHTHQVARILQHGLWRTMSTRSPLAATQLKRRCRHAGQSVEILCAALVLPDETTRERYLIATAKRLATTAAISVAPLAGALLQWRFHVLPPAADVPLLTGSAAWLTAFGLSAVNRRYPDETARFPADAQHLPELQVKNSRSTAVTIAAPTIAVRIDRLQASRSTPAPTPASAVTVRADPTSPEAGHNSVITNPAMSAGVAHVSALRSQAGSSRPPAARGTTTRNVSAVTPRASTIVHWYVIAGPPTQRPRRPPPAPGSPAGPRTPAPPR